jgi:hypothetical protein
MVDKVLSWIESEPVITRVGPTIGLIVVYLFAKGLIDRDTYDLVSGVLALLLGTGGVAGARAAVVPTAKLLQTQQVQHPGDTSGRHAG